MLIKYADKAWEIASAVLGPPLLGIAAGHYLDKTAGTGYFTVLLLVLGVFSGLWALAKIVRKIEKNLIE